MVDLASLRKTAHLTGRELSNMSGVDASMISYIESGKRAPSVSAAKRIAKVLGIHWAQFFEDEPQAPAPTTKEEIAMMELPKPPTVRAQEIILAQMERLDKLAEEMTKPDEEGETPRSELYDMESLAKAMAELNRELYRTFPPLAYPPPFSYPHSAD